MQMFLILSCKPVIKALTPLGTSAPKQPKVNELKYFKASHSSHSL